MIASAAHRSNMLPTTPPVVLVCLLQLALVLVARPALTRLLHRPRWWRPIVAVNSVAMNIYLWHMPAVLLLVIAAEHTLGPLPAQPDAVWWWSRPPWRCAASAQRDEARQRYPAAARAEWRAG